MTILDNNYGFENSAKIINTIKLYGSSKKFTSVTLNGVKIGKFSAGESVSYCKRKLRKRLILY